MPPIVRSGTEQSPPQPLPCSVHPKEVTCVDPTHANKPVCRPPHLTPLPPTQAPGRCSLCPPLGKCPLPTWGNSQRQWVFLVRTPTSVPGVCSGNLQRASKSWGVCRRGKDRCLIPQSCILSLGPWRHLSKSFHKDSPISFWPHSSLPGAPAQQKRLGWNWFRHPLPSSLSLLHCLAPSPFLL